MQRREMKQVAQERNVECKAKEEDRVTDDPPEGRIRGPQVDQMVRVQERLAKISPTLATTSVVKLNAMASVTLSQPHNAER